MILDNVVVTLDISQASEMLRSLLPDAQAVAREMHRAMFDDPSPSFDELPPEGQAVFVRRAEKMWAALFPEQVSPASEQGDAR